MEGVPISKLSGKYSCFFLWQARASGIEYSPFALLSEPLAVNFSLHFRWNDSPFKVLLAEVVIAITYLIDMRCMIGAKWYFALPSHSPILADQIILSCLQPEFQRNLPARA